MTADTAEREAFEKWAYDQWQNSRPPDNAWLGWQARAALPARAPEGWVLVPREPTPEMIGAAFATRSGLKNAISLAAEDGDNTGVEAVYAAMLSAAPPPPEQKEEEECFHFPRKQGKTLWAEGANPSKPRPAPFTQEDSARLWQTISPPEPLASPAPGPAEGLAAHLDHIEDTAFTPPYRLNRELSGPLKQAAPGPAEPEPFSDNWTFPAPEQRVIGKIAASAERPAEPVVRALEREIQHYIECSEHGLSKVPRGLLTRILSALQPAPAPVDKPKWVGWYCPHCQRGVDPCEVTFSECHEVCGTYIADAVPPAPVARQPQPSAEPKPIAWMWDVFEGGVWEPCHARVATAPDLSSWRSPTRNLAPLYPAPPPASDDRVAAMREKCARAIQALAPATSGPDYGMASEKERAAARREEERCHRLAEMIRALPLDWEG